MTASMTAAQLVDGIGWTLIHFTWQGALIAAETALSLAFLRNKRAETRYLVACTGLLACVLWPAAGLLARLHGAGHGEGSIALLLAGSTAGTANDMAWDALLKRHLAWIVGAWAVCVLGMALRMIAGLLWVRHVAAHERRAPAWQACVDRLTAGCGVRRAVRLRIVERLASPVTAGWWRPVVLVPAALATHMPPHLLEALLAHEIAHIRRHDYLVNLAQNVAEALLFYHPAVWWLSRRIRAEREHIADALAAEQLGEPRRLALALSELEKIQFSAPHLAQAANGGDLAARIRHLVRPGQSDLRVGNWKAAMAVLGFALAGLIGCLHTPPSVAAMAQASDVIHMPMVDFASCRKPAYPPDAIARGTTGTVTLDFLVSAEGRMRRTAVHTSSGDASLDEAARVALAQCTFKAGTVNGKPAELWTEVRYVWTLE